MEKSLQNAFRELIKKRKWYAASTRSPIQAKNDKATFLKGGNVPEERIRDYLSAAGWIKTKIEMWKKLN
jgi:hypothetical protein